MQRQIKFRGKRLDTGEPGSRQGKLIVLRTGETAKSGHKTLICQCDCGNIKQVGASDFRRAKIRSCGCVNSRRLVEQNTTHGGCGTKLYYIYRGMVRRCNNPNATDYANYGGRGIRVREDWSDFATFREWALNNGYSDNLTIDRRDVNGDYAPDNCRWIPKEEQARNRRIRTKYAPRNDRGQFIRLDTPDLVEGGRAV